MGSFCNLQIRYFSSLFFFSSHSYQSIREVNRKLHHEQIFNKFKQTDKKHDNQNLSLKVGCVKN